MLRRISPSRLSACLVLAGTLALCQAPAHAASTVRPGTYKLAIPAPGHVSVAAVEVTVAKHGRGRPPTRLDLSLPKRFSLPSSVRFFYARRRVAAPAPLRYELLLIALNRTTGKPARKARAAAQFDSGRVVLVFPSRASFGHGCSSCGKRLPRTTVCKRCWFRKTTTRHAQAVNADTADAAQLAPVAALLRAAWTNNGDSNAVFGNPAIGQRGDATLDGGHLDNGHAFGWTRQSLLDPAPLLHGVVDDILSGQQQKLIPDLELAGNADLNGNGRLDGATTPGGGASP